MKTPKQTITDYYNFVFKTWAPCPIFTMVGTQGPSPLIIEKANLYLAWDFLHVAIGLQGEALEIVVEGHTEEEVGDICYYLFILFNFLDIKPTTIANFYVPQPTDLEGFSEADDTFNICLNCEHIANHIKKAFIYDQGLNEYEEDIHETALAFFQQLCHFNDILKIITDNQAKLALRYPNLSFSTTDSANRADKQPTTSSPESNL